MNHTKDEICEKIILALDTPDFSKGERILGELDGLLKIVKIGSASYYRWGEKILKLVQNKKLGVFIDFKFHDIPNTVAGAIEGIIPWNIQMFTVHTLGGREMLKKAAQCTRECSKNMNILKPMVLGISILTSVDEKTLNQELKVEIGLQDMVSHLALLARDSGLDGIVASGHEIGLIRQCIGQSLKIICPGIRASSDAKGDQKRTLSAAEAINKGADYIVIGRPLYEAAKPREVFNQMISEIQGQ